MTETTALATRGYNAVGVKKYSSVGLMSPNVQAKVVDWATGALLPPGSIGELWLHTPGNMKGNYRLLFDINILNSKKFCIYCCSNISATGYLNNIDATVGALDKEGWLHTGDIVYFDREGYLYVIDRLKEVIKYKGFQVCLHICHLHYSVALF